MTLWVYSSVTYIVCVLDSEGQRMGLESLLIVEPFYTLFTGRNDHALHWIKTCLPKFCTCLAAEVQKVDRSHGSASVSSFAGGDQRGGAPPTADTAECAHSVLLASPTWTWPWSLRSMHVIQSMALAVQSWQNICFLAKKAFHRVNEWSWWMFSEQQAEVQCVEGVRTWKKIPSSLSFIIVAPPVSAASTWPWNRMTRLPES